MHLDDRATKQERIWQLKQSKEGLSTKATDHLVNIPTKAEMHPIKLIENFALFAKPYIKTRLWLVDMPGSCKSDAIGYKMSNYGDYFV